MLNKSLKTLCALLFVLLTLTGYSLNNNVNSLHKSVLEIGKNTKMPKGYVEISSVHPKEYGYLVRYSIHLVEVSTVVKVEKEIHDTLSLRDILDPRIDLSGRYEEEIGDLELLAMYIGLIDFQEPNADQQVEWDTLKETLSGLGKAKVDILRPKLGTSVNGMVSLINTFIFSVASQLAFCTSIMAFTYALCSKGIIQGRLTLLAYIAATTLGLGYMLTSGNLTNQTLLAVNIIIFTIPILCLESVYKVFREDKNKGVNSPLNVS